MAKADKTKLSNKIEVWVTPQISEAFEQLAHEQLLSVSNLARQALIQYLRAFGINPVPPRQAQPVGNGQHHEPERARG